MRSDEDDAPLERDAGERTRREVVVATGHVAQRVAHGVAGDVYGPRVRGFAQQVLPRAFGRREVEVGQHVDDAAVRLFRERRVLVGRAQAGLDVRDARARVERGETGAERGRRVTLNGDPIRARESENAGDPPITAPVRSASVWSGRMRRRS
jgi:hypothetical protein